MFLIKLFFVIILFLFNLNCLTSREIQKRPFLNGDDWVPYRKKNKWGFASPRGKIKLKANYKFVYPFYNDIAPVYKEKKGWVLINTKGEIISEEYYDNIELFKNGYSIYKIKNKNEFGVFNQKGEKINKRLYTRIENISDKRFLVTVDGYYGKFGFINTKGKEVIPLKYDYAQPFSEKRAVFGISIGVNPKTNKKILKFGYLTKKGKEVIPAIYNVVHSFSNGLAAVVKGSKLGFIDKKGNVIIPYIYDMVDYGVGFKEKDVSIVRLDQKILLINRNGQTIVEAGKYDSIEPFSEGRARVGKGNFRKKTIRFGYIDTKGKEVIPCIYEKAEDFSEGFASVAKEKDKYGYIDKNGKELTVFKYFYLDKFKNGFGIAKQIVKNKNKENKEIEEIQETFIDKNGKELTDFKFKSISFFEKFQSNYYGFVHTEGEDSFLNGGYIDIKGNEFFKN